MKFKKKRFLKKFIYSCFFLIALAIISIICILMISFIMGPPPMTSEENTTIYSANDGVIGVEKGMENRQKIKLEDISEKVIATTILIEDQHFYDHYGFDLRRIVGALWNNFKSLSLKEGASTITQQLARNLYLTHEKTWHRKLKEAFYTIRLEMHYTKDEILEGYLNTIYYGHGAYGVEAASQYFFNKPQQELSYAEAAMLTGIPKGPTHYSPFNNEEKANARKDMILTKLWQEKVITDAEYHMAKQEKLNYTTEQANLSQELAPHFQDMVMREAAELLHLTEEEVRSGGYHIFTTLDEQLQAEVEDILLETVPTATELEAAVLTVNPHSGAIMALSGGRDYTQSEFNRAVMAQRMPGSTFKPFLYYAALENGYTPLTKQMSKPTNFMLANGETYQPSNFNHHYANKPITLAQAVALSDNVYAVRTNLSLGDDTLARTAALFGFEGQLPAVPSLALGTAAVSLEDIVSGYAMLANGGKEHNPYTIEKIMDKNKKSVFERKDPEKKQVLDEQSAFILTQLLRGIFNPKLNGYMPVTGMSISHELSQSYAGKSGTTPSDNWMVGYSPSIVTGVWTGYDDNRKIEMVAEASYAKEIWAQVMEHAHEGKPQENFPTPNGVIGVPIDLETGLKATPDCGGENMIMYFIQGTEPKAYCKNQIHPETPDSDKGVFERWFQLFFSS